MGKIGTCSICGKEKTAVSQRNLVKSNVGVIDTYLECEDCGKNES